jgi:ABC-type cobalamin/Fe3+-siderophores transport system ATPase subunit
MRRVMLRFSPDVEIEFVDREKGIRQIYDFAERGMRTPLIVFGPEGCGKSAWLRQSAEILRENGYEVLYIDLFYKEFTTESLVL